MSDSPRPLTEEERQAIRQHDSRYVNITTVLRLLDLLEQSERALAELRVKYNLLASSAQERRERLEQSEARAAALAALVRNEYPRGYTLAQIAEIWGDRDIITDAQIAALMEER